MSWKIWKRDKELDVLREEVKCKREEVCRKVSEINNNVAEEMKLEHDLQIVIIDRWLKFKELFRKLNFNFKVKE